MVKADKIAIALVISFFTHTASLRDFGRKGGILFIMRTCQIRIICCNLRNVICANSLRFQLAETPLPSHARQP